MRILFFSLLLMLSCKISASPIDGAYLSLMPDSAVSGHVYTIMLTTFTDIEAARAHRGAHSITINDSVTVIAYEKLSKIVVGDDKWKNTYQASYTFSDTGMHEIQASLQHNPKYENYTAETYMTCSARIYIGSGKQTALPVLENRMPFSATTSSPYTFSPQWKNPGAQYTLNLGYKPAGNGYVKPSSIVPYQNRLEVQNGQWVWDKPNKPGNYLLCTTIKTYEQAGNTKRLVGHQEMLWEIEVAGTVGIATEHKAAALQISTLPSGALQATTAENNVIQAAYLFDMQGRLLDQVQGTDATKVQLHTLNASSGVLMVHTSTGILRQKWVKLP